MGDHPQNKKNNNYSIVKSTVKERFEIKESKFVTEKRAINIKLSNYFKK